LDFLNINKSPRKGGEGDLAKKKYMQTEFITYIQVVKGEYLEMNVKRRQESRCSEKKTKEEK